MQLAQPHPDCTISHEGRYVRAIVGPGSARQIQECWRTIAALALENKFSRALVVGTAAGEPLAQLAARDAVIALHEIGVPAGFKLAFVARTSEALNAFLHAEIAAEARGLRVKVFRDEAAATRWLAAEEVH